MKRSMNNETLVGKDSEIDGLRYDLPTLQNHKALQEFLDEHFEAGEENVILGQDLLLKDFPAWVRLIDDNATIGNAEWGKSLLYLCWDGDALVGILAVRPELSAEMEAIYGNIGFYVRPSKRNNGYATRMLWHALSICKEMGLESVTLGCYKSNAPSAAVIQKCGGVLVSENENYTPGVTSQYFTITLSKK